MVRNPFDQLAKELVRTALENHGAVTTDVEVPVNTRWIDVWFMPDAARAAVPESLGWFQRITGGSSTLEFFHNTPSGPELAACVMKHGEFRSFLLRTIPPPDPTQWVISSGRPAGGIEGLGFHPMTDWPSGIYEAPPLLRTRLVVVNELPVARDTLLLRLFGAGSVLKQAIAELQALQADAPERMLALPLLVKFRLAVPADPATRTSDDEEFLMTTHDIVEAWRQKAIEEGVEQGIEQGERNALLRQLRRRFGSQIDGEIERRLAAASPAQLGIWLERVLSARTLTEVLVD